MEPHVKVVVTRGDIVESHHRVEAAVVDATGTVVAQTPGASLVTYWRSSAKPFQTLPFVREALEQGIDVPDDELAVTAASHAAQPDHTAAVARLLARFDMTEQVLQCGPHLPMHAPTASAMVRADESPRPIHCNCSGKHAAMLCLARLQGHTLDDYLRPDHPVQTSIMDTIAAITGVAKDDFVMSVDGCGAPVMALPVTAMALAYARLGQSVASGAGRAPWSPWAPAARRVGRAMQRRPFYVSGTDRICTRLMETFGDDVVSKGGAEGVYCVALPRRGLGIALKVTDGAARATEPAILALLRALGVGNEEDYEALASFVKPPVRNNAGEAVGYVKAHLPEGFGALT